MSANTSAYPEPDEPQSFDWLGRQQSTQVGGVDCLDNNEEECAKSDGESFITTSTESPPASPVDFLEENESDDDISDADSDYIDLRSDLVKYKESVKALRQQNNNDADSKWEGQGQSRIARGRGSFHRTRMRGNRGRGVVRGPRKAAEPTGDIKFRMSQASAAFINERYEEAKDIVFEVIRINAETYEAWMLLASIWKELGDKDKTLLTLIYAAHLRPKEVSVWLNCARYALQETGMDRQRFLSSAKFCYSAAIRADPRNDFEARLGKAAVLKELQNHASALTEYRRILQKHPHHPGVLKLMAETYVDQDDVEAAKRLYRRSIQFYQQAESLIDHPFGWSDVNIYVELYGYLGQYAEAIKELKSLSRWLLGRREDISWDVLTQDDREWDADDSRRTGLTTFVPHQYSVHQYGPGLPLELRIKLGLYRLHLGDRQEAILHFSWLQPHDLTDEGHVKDFADLFLDVADILSDSSMFEEAIPFYAALRGAPDLDDAVILLKLGKCCLQAGIRQRAEDCFRRVIEVDDENVEARMHLATMLEQSDEQEQAFLFVNEIMAIQWAKKTRKGSKESVNDRDKDETFMPPPSARKSYYKPKRTRPNAERRADQETAKSQRLQEQYAKMAIEHAAMLAGDKQGQQRWADAANDLIEDFRGFRTFYPWDKYVQFMGYGMGSARVRPLTGATPLDTDLAKMADRLSNKLGSKADPVEMATCDVPENYRGIAFTEWLDIFMQYALCLVRSGHTRRAYEICEAAKDAIVWYHSRPDMFLIHVCHCTCALLSNDEETLVAVCRYFMREYQFTTDSYRMFTAVNRLSQSPISWYSSGPSQKYILRQIKAMDYALVSDESRHRFYKEKGSYTAQDTEGNPIINRELDIALLMLYGHILCTGTGYSYALNYFFRAYALDPDNPMINLSIGLGYIHYALKRQAENRQFHVLQGMAFLMRYYNSRHTSSRTEERQEADYNIARTYHLLGLTHLALPYYQRVLASGGESHEHLTRDAAFNLQVLLMMDGGPLLALNITEAWLVL